jgi:hypothetical protein
LKRSAILFCVALAALTAGSALAQTELASSVVGGGGRDAAGSGRVLRCTVGQGVIGSVSGPSYLMEIGYWRRQHEFLSDAAETPTFVWGLGQNHPNPFNPLTTISFSLPRESLVSLRVFDLRGRLVRTLLDESRPAGVHTVVWDGRDESGGRVASGTYVTRLVSSEGVLTRKMLLAK